MWREWIWYAGDSDRAVGAATKNQEDRRCSIEVLEEERQRVRAACGLLLPIDVPQSEKDSVDPVAICHAPIRSRQ